MQKKLTKRNKIIIAVAISIVLLATGITCAIVFWPKSPRTTQEWLAEFGTNLEQARMMTDQDGDIVPTNIDREIEIKENGVVVALYKQKLQMTTIDGKVAAYLVIEESYPTIGTTQDNVLAEYYFADGIMHIKSIYGETTRKTQIKSL
ncbi:MAG: hypothetical protein LBH18_02280 [Spirochaetaceae bacterium]|jgi:hypothetical protein|nr:hypothetical protein [Spirochaetaceae bacterium]